MPLAITTMRGPRWNSLGAPRQWEPWTDHPAFADGLVASGVIVLGGPVRDTDDRVALIAVEATDEAAVHSFVADDPWITEGILELKEIREWTI